MKNKKISSESGQVLVLVALALIALLGFTALAIDGSSIYADRRFLQNSADNASLAGASQAGEFMQNSNVTYANFTCGSAEVQSAIEAAQNSVITAAQHNGVVIDTNNEDNNGVTVECSDVGEKYLDIRTQATHTVTTSFAHLFYKGDIKTTVVAVARVRPYTPFGNGYAIVALNPDDCQGMNTGAEFHGTGNIYVEGGGIFSNGCMRGVGTQYAAVVDGSIDYRTEFINVGGSTFSPDPQQVPLQLDPASYELDPPACDASNTIDGKDLRGELTPGLICVDGDATINAHDTLIGYGVTIVMLNGRLQIDGQAHVELSAPAADPDPSPAIPGVVIYAPPDTNYKAVNQNGIHITGDSTSFFMGTILAPALDMYVNGNSENDLLHVQVIAWNVQVGGTADTNVSYTNYTPFNIPSMIDLYR